jgi:pyruvate-ferredoxin/flavodoxin oxidoreductase
VDDTFDIESEDVVRAVFFGLGADGTVGANKNSIKIIGEGTEGEVQGYFVYDSKKSGGITISHLRFGPRPIRAPYLIRQASFVACHQWNFLERYDMLKLAAVGAVFLLNAPGAADRVWDALSADVQDAIIRKKLRVFVVDAARVAKELGLGGRINTIMQSAFFGLSGVLPREEAVAKIKDAIRRSYERKGGEIVKRNVEAVDAALVHVSEIEIPNAVTSRDARPPAVSTAAPDFVRRVTAMIVAGEGDLLPVSAFPPDGTWPTATARWEKRGLAAEIPIWDKTFCIQCNKCAIVCPHAAIRRARERAVRVPVAAVQVPRAPRARLHDPGRPRRLHRLQPVRSGLSRPRQVEPQTEGDQHAAAGRAPRRRAAELRLLSRASRDGQDVDHPRRQEYAVRRASLRVLGGLCGLR